MAELSEFTVPLKTPVEVGGKRYESLTLRRPRTGEMRKLARIGALERLLALAERAEKVEASDDPADALKLLTVYDDLAPVVAILAGVDEAVVDALELEDTNTLIDKIGEVGLAPL